MSGRRFVSGVPLPLVADPFEDWKQSLVEAGDTRELVGRPLYPLRLSRLTWIARTHKDPGGLLLVSLNINGRLVAAGAGVILELGGSGVWRFPAVNVDPSFTIVASVRNPSGAPLRVVEMTLWGQPGQPLK